MGDDNTNVDEDHDDDDDAVADDGNSARNGDDYNDKDGAGWNDDAKVRKMVIVIVSCGRWEC